ncbi:hypothetical protein AWB82_00248 [Caballeronia glebae]|uniref:Uncharacterized protein n=1 Tax=Caballeronia glebae TaxID=1777143 RepID=A0A157Z5J5_9BURK|nr:hypothetical protein [Caballeronia glebae]SAK40846.1 hypothetical protein AWB82_00248 [Caballeronia glebae]
MDFKQVNYKDDGDLKGTLKQVAGVAAASAATAAITVELPVIAIAAIGVGAGIVAAKTVGAVWEFLFD